MKRPFPPLKVIRATVAFYEYPMCDRSGSPERVSNVMEERAPNGFAHLDEVASYTELEAIVKVYARMAGFDRAQANR